MKTKLLILAIAAIALAGCDDYEVAMAEAKGYCERVRAGIHTDYQQKAQYCDEVMKL